MIARDLVHTAESLGIILGVDGNRLQFKSLHPITADFKKKLRMNKSEIIRLLTVTQNVLRQSEAFDPSATEEGTSPSLVPPWCSRDCLKLEPVSLPPDGPTWGCIQKYQDYEEWKRLDWMKQCPRAIQNQQARILNFKQKPRANCI